MPYEHRSASGMSAIMRFRLADQNDCAQAWIDGLPQSEWRLSARHAWHDTMQTWWDAGSPGGTRRLWAEWQRIWHDNYAASRPGGPGDFDAN